MDPKKTSDLALSSSSDHLDKLSSGPIPVRLHSAQEMAELLIFTPTALPNELTFMQLLERVTLLATFLKQFNDIGGSAGSIAQLQGNGSDSLQTAMDSFRFTGLALKIIDFIRIPAIYLAFLIAGEKPPMTIPKNTQWLYSGVLLGLTIAALAAPVVAPIIAVSAASLGLAVGLVTLFKTFYQPYRTRQKLKAIEEEITTQTDGLNKLREQTIALEDQLSQTKTNEEQAVLRASIETVAQHFNTDYETKKHQLQQLHDTKFQYEKELISLDLEKTKIAILDKGLGLILSSIAVIGFALSLAFPPIGVVIIAATTIIGAVYLSSRITFSLFNAFIAKKSIQSDNIADTDELAEHSDLSTANQQQNEFVINSHTPNLSSKPFSESTTTIDKLLHTTKLAIPADVVVSTSTPMSPANNKKCATYTDIVESTINQLSSGMSH